MENDAVFEQNRDGDIVTADTNDLTAFVVVRTENAGVHIGVESSRDDDTIVLNQSRRIHYWEDEGYGYGGGAE